MYVVQFPLYLLTQTIARLLAKQKMQLQVMRRVYSTHGISYMITFELQWMEYNLKLGMKSLEEIKVLEAIRTNGIEISEMEFDTVKETVERTYRLFKEIVDLFIYELEKQQGKDPKQLSFLKEDNGNIDL